MLKGKRPKNPVTIKDVAQLARVAPSTVSKVLNGANNISESTRIKVEKAIEKLSYRPNAIARSLRSNRTRTIGIINNSRSNKNTFVLQLMVGVEEAASAAEFSVFLCNSEASQTREQEYLEVLLDKQVDGVIFLDNVVKERALPTLKLNGLPLVFLNQYPAEPKYPAVLPDDMQGGFLATKHLLSIGHKRIGFIAGRVKHKASHLRLEGYKSALKHSDIPFETQLIQGQDTWDEKGGYLSTHHLIGLKDPPTALFCASDTLAIGALDALREHQLIVPKDIALVGFDNSLAASQKRPPLTSVTLPFGEMGRLATSLLLAEIQGNAVQGNIHHVPCTLAKRESCGYQNDS